MGNISCKNLEELSFERLKILNIVLSLQQNVIRKTKKVKLRFITCKFPLRCMPEGGRPKGQRREKSRVLPLQSGSSGILPSQTQTRAWKADFLTENRLA